MQKLAFSNNFWWGAATSGPQSEGQFEKIRALDTKSKSRSWF